MHASPTMASGDNVLLAIRTVLVTTRAAARSHAATGDDPMARRTARLGLQLLDDVATSHAGIGEPAVSEAFQAARAELLELVRSSDGEGVTQRH